MQQIIALSRRVAIASIVISLAAFGLFLFTGSVGMWALKVAPSGLVVAMLTGIGAIVIGGQSRAGKSQAPAVAVTLAVVLLIAYVSIMAYVISTLDNFSDQ